MMDLFLLVFLLFLIFILNYFVLDGLDNRSVFIFATRADGDTYVCRVSPRAFVFLTIS